MAFKFNKKTPKQTKSPTVVKPLKNSLDSTEITIILNLIKNTTFRGDNIEAMYNLIVKLQNQYLKIKN
tara:strand:- start:216 stop:419 length:204 start_codon:yes stop_codon:yes gene_type:complete